MGHIFISITKSQAINIKKSSRYFQERFNEEVKLGHCEESRLSGATKQSQNRIATPFGLAMTNFFYSKWELFHALSNKSIKRIFIMRFEFLGNENENILGALNK